MGIKGVTTFILKAVAGSSVHTACSDALPRPAKGSAPQNEIISLGGRSQSPHSLLSLWHTRLSAPCFDLILQEHRDCMLSDCSPSSPGSLLPSSRSNSVGGSLGPDA